MNQFTAMGAEWAVAKLDHLGTWRNRIETLFVVGGVVVKIAEPYIRSKRTLDPPGCSSTNLTNPTKKQCVTPSSSINATNSPYTTSGDTVYPFSAMSDKDTEISDAKAWLKSQYSEKPRKAIFELVIDLKYLDVIPDGDEARKHASDYMKNHFQYVEKSDGSKQWKEIDVPNQNYKTNLYEYHELPYIIFSLRESYMKKRVQNADNRAIKRMDIQQAPSEDWVSQLSLDIAGMLVAGQYPYSAGSNSDNELIMAADWVNKTIPKDVNFLSVAALMRALGFSTALQIDGYENQFENDSKEMFCALTECCHNLSYCHYQRDNNQVEVVKYLVRALRKQYLSIRKHAKSTPKNNYIQVAQ